MDFKDHSSYRSKTLRNHFAGAFGALVLLAVAACAGGAPGGQSPTVPNVGSGSLASGSQTITLPASSGFGVGTVEVSGSGSLSASQSASPPTGVSVLSLAGRAATVRRDQTGGDDTAVAYVTITATSASSFKQVQLSIAPTASAPSGTYYMADWNGTEWAPVGSVATVSNGVIKTNSGTLNPPISLAAGSSYYLAIYSGSVLPTPTPAPGAPVLSVSSATLSEGQQLSVTVTSQSGLTVGGNSESTSIATVTPATQTVGSGGTVSFTVTAGLTAGTTTINFTDSMQRTSTLTVTVANPTMSVGDVVPVQITGATGSVTVTSANTAVAAVNTSGAATGSSSVSTTSGSFDLVGVAGGQTTITLTDSSGTVGTISLTVSAIADGAFDNATTASNWVPCSYDLATAKGAAVNPASPVPNTPEPSQTASGETPVPLASLSPLVVPSIAPPANDNPGFGNYSATSVTPDTGSVTIAQDGITSTIVTPASAPTVLGNDVMLLGSVNSADVSYPKGEFGVCQKFTVPTPPPSSSGPYLSFYVLEGGSEYTFKEADQEAALFQSLSGNVASTLDEYLFAEDNCYMHPTTASPAGLWGGAGVDTDSGCWPQTYGGDTDNYYDWLQGGFWSPRGPYNLSAYAGQSVTLFLGNWSYYHDSAAYYAQFMYVGNVQTTFSATSSPVFPSTGPLTKSRKLTVTLPTKTTQ